MNKFIYIVQIKFSGILSNAYLRDDIFHGIYFTYEDALRIGLDELDMALESYRRYYDLYEPDLNNINYSFQIEKISCNSLTDNADDDDQVEETYEKTFNKNIDNLEEYLISLMGYVTYNLDIHGNIINIETLLDDVYPINFKSLMNDKFHLEKFKIGDYVKLKNSFEGKPDKVYKIFNIENRDKSIYDSDDPLYFKQGYCLTDEYDEFCNNIIHLNFDEDLIESSKEEYDKYYKKGGN